MRESVRHRIERYERQVSRVAVERQGLSFFDDGREVDRFGSVRFRFSSLFWQLRRRKEVSSSASDDLTSLEGSDEESESEEEEELDEEEVNRVGPSFDASLLLCFSFPFFLLHL